MLVTDLKDLSVQIDGSGYNCGWYKEGLLLFAELQGLNSKFPGTSIWYL